MTFGEDVIGQCPQFSIVILAPIITLLKEAVGAIELLGLANLVNILIPSI